MAEVFSIETYQYYQFSSRDSLTKAVAICQGNLGTGYPNKTAFVYFVGKPDPLPLANKFNEDTYRLYYDYADMPLIVDMLRNEKPVYVIFNGTSNSRLATGSEPVGEGEIP